MGRLLLLVQLLLLTGVLTFSVIHDPAVNPHGLMSIFVAMIAVSAMACQSALLRLALPGAPATAVMTGNVTSSVLSLLDTLSGDQPLMEDASERWRKALSLVVGFFTGCVAGAAGVSLLGDWAWSLPVALAAAAVALTVIDPEYGLAHFTRS